jgi:hypothetical protein
MKIRGPYRIYKKKTTKPKSGLNLITISVIKYICAQIGALLETK